MSILTRRSSTIRWYASLHYSLHIPVSPGPFQQLCNDDPILPNPYNGVFHLRSNQMLAVQKAREHMMWKDDGRGIAQDQELYKKWQVCTLKIFAFGYMVLTEKNVLRKDTSKDGHYAWHGPIWKQSFTEHQILHQIQDEFMEVV